MGLIEIGLSKVGESKTHGEDSPYFGGWKAYDEDPYDEFCNPCGIIQMGLAENQVSFDLLEQYMEKHLEAKNNYCIKTSGFREIALFQDYHGLQSFRRGMASFMEQIGGGRAKFNPDRIVITAGATAANEILTFILADPGDAILIPTPYYPGFDRDVRWRTGVNIVPIECDSSNNFEITIQAMEAAFMEAKSKKMKARAMLITNPSNPLGATIKRSVLDEILEFVARKNMHLVSDEIYSGSAFSSEEFVSVAEILKAKNHYHEKCVHIVYSLSKDLGIPGFRVGTIYSYNDKVMTTARRMSSFSLISSETQKLLATILLDTSFTENYIRSNRERLKKRYETTVEGLRSIGIECFNGNAGLFCWINLRRLMKEGTRDEELRLWKLILYQVKISISPGSSCNCKEVGWFRVCYANMSEQTLKVALTRFQNFMEKTSVHVL